ncbi:MAG: tetratricopeptide repeat protein, partial [Cyanobacteria bacterium]|nr:tetratricopeptide repeat protein [Cyanobacteriota bacterium]
MQKRSLLKRMTSDESLKSSLNHGSERGAVLLAMLFSIFIGSMQSTIASDFPLKIAMTDEVRSMCERAEQLINSGKIGDAMKVLHQAEGMDPSCGEVHGYLGMALQNSGRTQDAIGEYQRAFELNPQMGFLLVNIGNCYLNLSQPDQAVPFFQRYLQENPNAPDAAQVRMSIKQAGARRGQQDLRSIMERGQALINQNKVGEARKVFEQAVALNPSFAPGHFYLGYALGKSGDAKRAIEEFQTCLRLDPNVKEAVMNIASNYQSLGDVNAAIGWYERYVNENPGSPKSREIKSRIDALRQQANSQKKAVAASGLPQEIADSPDNYLAGAASDGKFFRWARPRMPVRVFIADGTGIGGWRPPFNQILADAFLKWARASENRLTFNFVNNPNQADVLCEWTDNPSQVVQAGRTVEGGLTKLNGTPMPNGVDVDISRATMMILAQSRT